MLTDVIKLNFTTPLHLGKGSDELDDSEIIYHSDSLKSAIYATGLPYYDEWQNHEYFFNGFTISSAFPFCKNELFLPKPQAKFEFDFTDLSIEKVPKKAKKISFISSSIVFNWLKNTNKPIKSETKNISPDGRFLFQNSQNTKNIFIQEVQQRVKVPKEGMEEYSTPYYLDRLYFDSESGLFFFAQFNNLVLKTQVLKVIELLGDFGIGTERNTGNGFFKFKKDTDLYTIDMPTTEKGNNFLFLGLYLPEKKDLENTELTKSNWGLIKRGGYIAATPYEEFMKLRKNNIYFINEGSILNIPNIPIGKTVNLKPKFNDPNLHDIWRDGNPIFIQFNM